MLTGKRDEDMMEAHDQSFGSLNATFLDCLVVMLADYDNVVVSSLLEEISTYALEKICRNG